MKYAIKHLAYFFLSVTTKLAGSKKTPDVLDRKKINALPLWLAIGINLQAIGIVVFVILAPIFLVLNFT